MKPKQIKQDDITLEASLLKAMSNRKAYKQFNKTLDKKKLIPITAKLLTDYETYYKQHKTDDIDWGLFYTEFSQNWHKDDLDGQDLAYYRETVFPLIQNSVVDDGVYIALLEREAATSIQKILETGYDEVQINEINSSLARQKSKYLNQKDETIFKIGSCDLSTLDNSNGVEWFMPSLQASLGAGMPGQFVVVAADSDTGKSAFCISQAVHTFKQQNESEDKRPILYCTSEDTKEDLACRFLSCLYKERAHGGFEEIIEKFTKVSEQYTKQYDDGLFIGMPIRGHSDMYEIRQKIELYNPRLIVIDMLDKLSASDNIQDLTKLYQEFRGIANDGYFIIGTSQTGNTSYQDKDTKEYKHRRWLTDKDLANSKSGKQGAAYCMIMIGKDDDVPSIRYISTTKKKRGKHCNITAEISEIHSFYREIL